jgi:hypothetical protein
MDKQRWNIVAIGRNPSDFEIGCIGMLSKYSMDGTVSLIMTGKSVRTEKNMALARKKFMKFGITQVYFTDKFDESSVTQENVNSLRSIIGKINPSIVIMPFPETPIKQMSVVGHSSLLASREIKNTFMYEISKNKKFLSNIFFSIETDSSKGSSLPMSSIGNSTIKERKKSLTKFYSHEIKRARIVESFKSHRLLLLDPSELT